MKLHHYPTVRIDHKLLVDLGWTEMEEEATDVYSSGDGKHYYRFFDDSIKMLKLTLRKGHEEYLWIFGATGPTEVGVPFTIIRTAKDLLTQMFIAGKVEGAMLKARQINWALKEEL